MPIGAQHEPHLSEQVSAIRQFNRFYTARLGLLRRRHLDGDFALTEARILYEVGASPSTTASALRQILELDAGYISRLLSALTRRKLVRQAASESDAREKHLTLTATGTEAVARINRQSAKHIETMLARLTVADREAMVTALARVRFILAESSKPPVRIERLSSSSSQALDLLHEYYEAVHVVQRDTPAGIRKMLKALDSGMWLAFLADEVVGCVVLRKLDSIPHAAECKRLYVRPTARGNRIADKLLDAMEAFARSRHIQWIYLDTYDDLKTAIALYERRGYMRCERYNDNPQATLFMRKHLG
ncbi:MAG: helix-turn-helix domain-containing GNAT family N-acetyltransferase [Terracidiphilus sp.]